MSVISLTHAAHGAIGLQSDWSDPYRDPNILPDWNDAVWSIDASPVVLNTLTATNNKYTDQTATASDASTVAFTLDPDTTDTSEVATLTLTGTVTPNKDSAYQAVLYQVLDPNGSAVASGTLAPGGSTIHADWTNFSPDSPYTINAGVDQNGDGTLDATEVTRTLQARANKTPLSFTDTSETGSAPGNPIDLAHAAPNNTASYHYVQAKDSRGQNVPATLQCEVFTNAGNPVTVSTATAVQTTGPGGAVVYRIDITAGGGIAGTLYYVKVSVSNDPTNFVRIYFTR